MDKLTTGFDGEWNQLAADKLNWAGSEFAFAVLCGPAISNVRTVKLTGNEQQLRNDITIHLLFSSTTAPGMHTFQVKIPKSAIEIKENTAYGYFLFDIMDSMYWKEGERFAMPDSIFISAVYKNYFSKPGLIVFEKGNK
jgi:hypothetical protein